MIRMFTLRKAPLPTIPYGRGSIKCRPGIILSILLLAHLSAAQTADIARQQYQARCVGCHGEDGTGGGHGPSIVDVRQPRATTKTAVRDVILKGFPEGGMPAFKISSQEADAIAAYVMVLKS